MSQPKMNEGWRERMELRLEGGGHLPGASEVVAIKHQVSSCSAARKDNLALVRGEIDIYVYYRLYSSERVRGQGAKVPWYAEVPIPHSVYCTKLGAQVVDVEHEHTFNGIDERFSHTMRIVFDVWALSPNSAGSDQINHFCHTRDDMPDRQQDPCGNCNLGERPNVEKQRLSVTKVPDDTEAQMPAWAREAAEEMMRMQQPAVKRQAPARRSMDRHSDSARAYEPKLGSAQGAFTRAGQPFEGPEPEWPTDAAFELLEAMPEPEAQLEPEVAVGDAAVLPPPLTEEKEDPPVTQHDTDLNFTNPQHMPANAPSQPMEPTPDDIDLVAEAAPNTASEPDNVTETGVEESSADQLIPEPIATADRGAVDLEIGEEPTAPTVTEAQQADPERGFTTSAEEQTEEDKPQVTATVPDDEVKQAPSKPVSQVKKEENILVWKPFPRSKLT